MANGRSAVNRWAAVELSRRHKSATTQAEKTQVQLDILRARKDPAFAQQLAEAGEHGRWSSGAPFKTKLGLGAGVLSSLIPGTQPVTVPLAIASGAALAGMAVPTGLEAMERREAGLPWGWQAAEAGLDLFVPGGGKYLKGLKRPLKAAAAAKTPRRFALEELKRRPPDSPATELIPKSPIGGSTKIKLEKDLLDDLLARVDEGTGMGRYAPPTPPLKRSLYRQLSGENLMSPDRPGRRLETLGPPDLGGFQARHGFTETAESLARDPMVDLDPSLAKFAQEGGAGLQTRAPGTPSLSEGIRRRRMDERRARGETPLGRTEAQRTMFRERGQPSRLVRPLAWRTRSMPSQRLVAQRGKPTPGMTLPYGSTVEQVRHALDEPLSFATGAGKSAPKVPGQTLGSDQWRYDPRLKGWSRQGRGPTRGGRGPGGGVGALESASFIHDEAIEALAKQRGISLRQAGDILMKKVDIPGTTTALTPISDESVAAYAESQKVRGRIPGAQQIEEVVDQTPVAARTAGGDLPVQTSVPPVDDAIDDARQILEEVGGGAHHTADELVDTATGAAIKEEQSAQHMRGTSVSNLIDLVEQEIPSGIMSQGARASMSWVRRVLPRIAEDEQQLILKGGEEGEHILRREFWHAGGLRAKSEDLKKGIRGGSSPSYLHASRERGTGRYQREFTLLEEGRPADKVVDFFLQVEKLDKAGNVVKFGNRTVAEATAVKSALQDLIADNINKGTISPNLRRLYQQNLDGSPILNKKGRPKLSPTFLRGKKGTEAYKDLTIKQRQEIEINEQYRKRAEAFLTEVFRTEALSRIAQKSSGATLKEAQKRLFPDIRGSLFKFLGGESTLSAKQIKQQNIILEEIKKFEGSIASFLGAILGAEQLMRQEMPIGTTG